MPIFNNALAGAAGSGGAAAGYKIERSLRFNSGDSPYLNKTPSSAGNRGKWTWSGWVKRSKLGAWSVIFSAAGSGSNDYLAFEPSDRLTFDLANTGSGRKLTTRVFRDCSAFYHIVLAVDYTSATASDRIKLYVNGVLETAFDTDSAPAQNHSGNVNNNTEHRISSVPTTGIDFFNGYLADVHFLDGLTPGTSTDDVNGSVTGTPNAVYLTDFGEFDATTGVWNPIRFTGTYGTNGFHLDFSDNSSKDALGIDAAGSNHWTVNNLIAQGPTTATQFKVYGNASNTGSSSATNVSSLTTLQSTNVSTYNSLGTIYNHLTADLGSVGTHAIQARTYLNTGSDILVFASDNGSSWSSISNQQDPYVFTGRYIQWVRTGQGYDNQVLTAVTAAQETDSLLDSPTNYEAASGNNGGNYCTFNPLDINSQATLSNGNLDWSTTNGNGVCRGTIAVSSGKWYWEYTYNQKPSGGGVGFGVLGVSESKDFPGAANAPDGYTYYSEGSSFTKKYGQGSNSNYGADFAVGDVIGVALDLDNGTITFYKNGVSQGQAFSGISGTYAPSISSGTSVGTGKASFNAGQRPFAISSVPTGFKSLCTQNLDDPLIANGSTAFDAVAYSGSGAARSISLGFSPDLVWTKQRNGTSWHYLIDTVRGNTVALFSNTNNGDSANNSQILTAFNSDGYSLGNDTAVNSTNNTYIAWAWDAGANSSKTFTVKVVSDSGNKYRFDDFGTSAVTLDLEEGSTYVFDQSDSSNSGHPLRFSTTSNGTHGGGSEYTTGVTATGTPGSAGAKTTIVVASGAPVLHYYCSAHSGMGGQANTNSTAGASNFDGTIQSTVKASQEAGFSIASYIGSGSAATVGHGLNTHPSLVICKDRASEYWVVWFEGFSSNEYLYLNGTDAKASWSGTWGSTPTSSVFGVSDQAVNQSSNNFIAYCFAPVEGFSSFGSYVGNGSANGPFVHTTHSVAFLLIKRTNSTGSWVIVDNKRDGYNETYKWLEPNTATAEQSITPVANVDFLSNGFKLRGNGATTNASGGAYMYWAIAENPFQVNGGLAR